jgi:hypothetical protein
MPPAKLLKTNELDKRATVLLDPDLDYRRTRRL